MASAEQLAADLTALVKPRTKVGTSLPEAAAVSSIGAGAGIGLPRSTPSAGGGIASPLTETAYADRLFYAERTLTSSDGLFTIKWKPIKQVKFNDANMVEAVFVYDTPP